LPANHEALIDLLANDIVIDHVMTVPGYPMSSPVACVHGVEAMW
jgi:hypothetical protein